MVVIDNFGHWWFEFFCCLFIPFCCGKLGSLLASLHHYKQCFSDGIISECLQLTSVSLTEVEWNVTQSMRYIWEGGCGGQDVRRASKTNKKNVLACFLCSLAPLFSNWTPAKERISVKDKWLLVDLAFAIQEVNPPQFDWKSVAWTLQLMYFNVLDSFCPDEPKLALKVIFKWITLCYSECICKNCNF